ncbi:MAG: PEP-CTERM sorting domain-containing protein [Bythopirellula sp.]
MKHLVFRSIAVAAVALLAFGSSAANAALVTAYIDLGDRDNDLNTGLHGGAYWTTIDSNGTTATLTDSATDAALAWTLGVTNVEGDSPNSVGPTVPASHIFTTSDAATDGLWNRPSGIDQRLVVTIWALDASGAETYDLSLYGNRSNSDDAAAIFEVKGAGALISSGTIAQGNTTGTNTPWDVAGVQADGSGQIVIELATPSGVDLSILSAMSITAIPEPSTIALAGLGLLGLAAVRRRAQ